jgi:hypothetical protein
MVTFGAFPTSRLRRVSVSSREKVSMSVKSLRTARGMTLANLSDALRLQPEYSGKSLTPGYLRRKAAGNKWTLDDVDALSRVFDVPPARIVDGYRVTVTVETEDGRPQSGSPERPA